MATTYPTTKQEFTNPTSTSKQNNPSHSTLHANTADTIEAIEDKLGTTGSLISGCGGLYPGSDSATALKLCQADGTTSIMTIDTSNKYVGIGIEDITMAAQFTIQGTGGNNFYMYRYSDNANPPSIITWKARGTAASPTKVNDADDCGKFESWGWARNQGDTEDAWVRLGMIVSEVDGVDAEGRIGGKFSIYTSPGLSITPSLIMTIDKDSIDVEKIAEATAGTQYNSYDLRLRGSVWDTDNTQAEDRDIYMRVNAGSGADGSEPYDLTIYDNSDNALLIINPLTPTIQIQQYLGHISDPNTAIEFGEDRFKILCGGVVGFDFFETTQDVMYIGNGALGTGADIDIYIGTNNAIQIAGDTGYITLNERIFLTETGSQQIYSYEGTLSDPGNLDLPGNLAGFIFVTFDEGGGWAICNITDTATVSLAANSANVRKTNVANRYCIVDNGTNVRIINNTGVSVNIKILGTLG